MDELLQVRYSPDERIFQDPFDSLARLWIIRLSKTKNHHRQSSKKMGKTVPSV